MNTESIKSAIRKAVDESKEKTWYDFHGIAYEEMYEFLGDKYVTIPKDEYEHLQQCKEQLILLHETYVKSMRTDMATSQMAAIISQQLNGERKMNKPRIYISGPISGYEKKERQRVFKEAHMILEAQGWEVFNPMENGLPDEATTYQHMKVDIRHLLLCDAIYLLRRWTHSKWCKVEFDVATAIGLDVYFDESNTKIKFT